MKRLMTAALLAITLGSTSMVSAPASAAGFWRSLFDGYWQASLAIGGWATSSFSSGNPYEYLIGWIETGLPPGERNQGPMYHRYHPSACSHRGLHQIYFCLPPTN